MTVVLDPEGRIETQQTLGDPEEHLAKDSYAIIGTREPDAAQAEAAFRLAWAISTLGNKIVRTGAAHGIDQKAMEGTSRKNLEVYLPWLGYNKDIVPAGSKVVVYNPAVHGDWTSSVEQYHPAARRLSRGAYSLHARNYGIVAGCVFVIAFPNKTGQGGTGQGLRIAHALNIPTIQANTGTITDAPRFIGKCLQQLGFANKDLAITIPGNPL